MNFREHAIENGKIWATSADGQAWVMIPISQISNMNAEQIGSAVLSLCDHATATQLLRWLSQDGGRCFHPLEQSEDKEERLKKLCTSLGNASQAEDFRKNLISMKMLKSKDPEIRNAYTEICRLLDAAFRYLQAKKSKLTPVQHRAMELILDVRDGCKLCGVLDGGHAGNCLKVRPNPHLV